MNNSEEFIIRAYRMRFVNRCSGTSMLETYTLDSHGFYVAELFMLCAKEEGIEVSADDLFIVMHHDIIETETGDLLYPVKHLSVRTEEHWDAIEKEIAEGIPVLSRFTDAEIEKQLSPVALRLFKACDMLELLLRTRHESRKGNGATALHRIHVKALHVIERCEFASVKALAVSHEIDYEI